MPRDAEFEDKVVETAFSLAEEMPWASVSVSTIAEAMGRPLSDFYGLAPVSELITAWLDRACASEPVDETESLRERLFDIAMLRFERMEDHRTGVMAWQDSWMRHPVRRALAAKFRVKSARWILTIAGEDANALSKAKALVLSGILFRAEQAWRKEDSPDFTRTMAQLDRDLRDVDGWVERLTNFSFRPAGKKKAAEETAAY